jgi:hypothetical protein
MFFVALWYGQGDGPKRGNAAVQVTDRGVEELVKSLTSLVTLNIIGCHRLTPRAKCQVARLLDNPFNI